LWRGGELGEGREGTKKENPHPTIFREFNYCKKAKEDRKYKYLVLMSVTDEPQ